MAELTSSEDRDGYIRDPQVLFAGAIHDGRAYYLS